MLFRSRDHGAGQRMISELLVVGALMANADEDLNAVVLQAGAPHGLGE
jgi:hypothetical protein